MNKVYLFFMHFLITAFRHIGSIAISVILLIVGAIWSKVCLYIGIFLLASNVIVALVGAIRMHIAIKKLAEGDTEYGGLLDKLSADPRGFFAEMMEEQEAKKQLHGQELLTLSDDDLFETVYLQNIDIAEESEDDEKELEQFTGARRTVYILGLFDSEIQNGGLCQFFVNSSRAVAPYVSEELKRVEAIEYLNLFEDFVKENNIDLSDLESFKVFSVRGFKRQTKRFDFDSFDDQYYELPPLQDKVVAFIKEHIAEF